MNNKIMPATTQNDEAIKFIAYPVYYYPTRLSDWELDVALPMSAKHCRIGSAPSNLLAAYLHAVSSFERERRTAIEAGNEILEVCMPEIPCHAWEGCELACALSKIISLTLSNAGELREMFQHLQSVIVGESQWRLGLRD